jgi:hypothetical protein
MSPRHLEGHQTNLPRPPGRAQRLLQPAHLQHVDRPGAEQHRPLHGDRVDDAAVDEVLVADSHRRQDPGHRAGGQHHIGQVALGEPVLGRALMLAATH